MGDSVFAIAPPEQAIPAGITTAVGWIRLFEVLTDWLFVLLLVVAVGFIILAAFQFIVAAGDPAGIAQARRKLLYAGIGVGVAALAGGVSLVLEDLFGVVRFPPALASFSFENTQGLTLQGDAQIGAGGCVGGLGKCLQLDGAGDAADAGRADDPVFQDMEEVSVAAWFKMSRLPNPGDNGFGIVTKGQTASTASETFTLTLWQGWLRWRPCYPANPPAMIGASCAEAWSTSPLPVGTWTHAVATYSRRAARSQLYINGERVREVSAPDTALTNTSTLSLQIGGSGRAQGFYFDGRIDEVVVFGEELSKKQVKALFEAGSP